MCSSDLTSTDSAVNTSPFLDDAARVRLMVSLGNPTRSKKPGAIYYVSENGEKKGPFTPDELRQFSRHGLVKSTTLIFKEGEKDWRTMATFPELNRKG